MGSVMRRWPTLDAPEISFTRRFVPLGTSELERDMVPRVDGTDAWGGEGSLVKCEPGAVWM